MREKKRKTVGGGQRGEDGATKRQTHGQDREERTRMLIGLKLNPVHLSLATSVPSALRAPSVRYYCEQKSERSSVELLSFLFSTPPSLPPSAPSYPRIGFVERLDRVSCGKDSHQFVEMYVDIRYTRLTYTSRRMEDLFSDQRRPVWPFYGDVKLISDWEERCRGDRDWQSGRRRWKRTKRRWSCIIRSVDAMSSQLKSIGCFFSFAR